MDDGARVKRDICATGEERAASPARTRHVDSSPTCSTYNQRPVHLECRPWRSCAVDTRHDFRHEGRKLSSSEGGGRGEGESRVPATRPVAPLPSTGRLRRSMLTGRLTIVRDHSR